LLYECMNLALKHIHQGWSAKVCHEIGEAMAVLFDQIFTYIISIDVING
jgi:hypothetical protein